MSNTAFAQNKRQGDVAVACVGFNLNIHRITYSGNMTPLIDSPDLMRTENLRQFFSPEAYKAFKDLVRKVHQTRTPEKFFNSAEKNGMILHREIRIVPCCDLKRVLMFVSDSKKPEKVERQRTG